MDLDAEHFPGTLHRIVPRIEAYACMRTILTPWSSWQAPEYLADLGNAACEGVFMELVAEHCPATLHRIVPRIEAYACMRTILTPWSG